MSAAMRTRLLQPAMVVCAVALMAAASARRGAAQDPRPDVQRANTLLDASHNLAAESLYVSALSRIPRSDASLRAVALFGRAFAAQGRILAGDTSPSFTPVDTIVQSYREAARLRPDNRFSVANNLAHLYRALGRNREACVSFAEAARLARREQATALFVSSAEACEAAGESSRAAAMYGEALRRDSTQTAAARGWMQTQVDIATPDAILTAAEQWRTDSSKAGIVVTTMPRLMLRERRPIEDVQAARALAHLATALPVARMSPSAFTTLVAADLRQVSARRPALSSAITALLQAYSPRTPRSLAIGQVDATWWQSSRYGQNKAWSALLRWMGDWYNKQENEQLAKSFYEAAIGRGAAQLNAPWVDRSALVPLALIYAKSDSGNERNMQRQVQQFTEIMFSAKGSAYQKNDLEQIREFHTALGAFYASRGEWRSGDARNAEFQLSRMRSATQQLNAGGKRFADPPDLLAQLATHYERTNRASEATVLKQEVALRKDVRIRAIRTDSITIRPRGTLPTLRTPVTRRPQEIRSTPKVPPG